MAIKKIKCKDGVSRTPKEYKEWIKNLVELAECEPGDLTDEERATLIYEGYDDVLDLED